MLISKKQILKAEDRNYNFLNKERYNQLLLRVNGIAGDIFKRRFKDKDISKINDPYKYLRKYDDGLAYSAYCSSKCNSKEDLIRIAGMAYSWMPTMLDLYFGDNGDNYEWDALLDLIEKIKNNDEKVRYELVEKLSKGINNSIVGASKVLHIINPEFVPFVDSRVIVGWNSFFKNEIEKGNIIRLPSNWNFNEKNHSKKVAAYIEYWDKILKWKQNIGDKNIKIRDLEVPFYYLGM